MVGALFLAVAGALANLLGWDIRGWFEQLLDTINDISTGYLLTALLATLVVTAPILNSSLHQELSRKAG